MNAQHPSRRRLQRWLDTGDTRRVSKHIDRCEDCQSVLETISALDEELVADLQAATAPPADLTERTHEGVDDRLRNEAAIGAFADLFTVGWSVARCIVDPDGVPALGEITDRGDAHERLADADESDGGTR